MTKELACDLSVFTAEERAAHEERYTRIFGSATGKKPIDNGYAFKIPVALWDDVTEYVKNERRCCPFFDFVIRLGHDDTLWLELGGSEDIKQFLETQVLQM